jgi:YD repeat-containing protein
LTVTVNPADTQPAKLNYLSESQTFEAQGATMKMTYTAQGLVIEMSAGRYVSTTYKSPWAGINDEPFKTLHVNFADGVMTSFKAN